jgi:predicted DNA-binding transcriptional regulator YafY
VRRAERLFQIIQLLRRSTLPVTGAPLAAELEVSVRTVYRDIADLMGQRVPITGQAGFGYLLSAECDMPPLMLTPAELEAIVLGAQWVAGCGDPLLSPAASDVLAKDRDGRACSPQAIRDGAEYGCAAASRSIGGSC